MLKSIMALTNRPAGRKLNGVIRKTGQELQSVLAGAGVNALFMPHATDTSTGQHGARWAMARVMLRLHAVNKRAGVTAGVILAQVRPELGRCRYSNGSLSVILSRDMLASGQVRKGWVKGAPKGSRVRYWLTPDARRALRQAR